MDAESNRSEPFDDSGRRSRVSRIEGRQMRISLLVICAISSTVSAQRAEFLRLIDRPKTPLAAKTGPATHDEAIEKQSFSFASEEEVRVPGIAWKSLGSRGPLPVVFVLHGTGATKESHLPLMAELAARGFLAVAIDGRYHGQRTPAGKGSADYVAAMAERYRTGSGPLPFLYDTVWDTMRLIDYLETRPDVDARRIGAIGFSKGGMELYLAAAADPRIRVAVPCIGVQSFRWALDHDSWQSRVGTFRLAVDEAARQQGSPKVDATVVRKFYDRVAPGIYSVFDGPKMVPLIAPRPLLVINGDSDARTPRDGLMECVAAAKAAYAQAGAGEAFEFLLQSGTGHRVNPDALSAAVRWLERWLVSNLARNP
jgi:dienelactone hydrolase